MTWVSTVLRSAFSLWVIIVDKRVGIACLGIGELLKKFCSFLQKFFYYLASGMAFNISSLYSMSRESWSQYSSDRNILSVAPAGTSANVTILISVVVTRY